MKKMVLGAVAALTLAGAAFAGEVTVEFENKISSDVVTIKDGNSEFAGIKEQVTAELSTEKVDVGVSLITYFNKDDNDNFGLTEYEFDKAYVELKPVDWLGITFNRKVFTEGSYLTIWDDNIANGDIGSNLGLFVRPVENLTIGAGVNVPSVFANEAENKFDFTAGVDYTTDVFSVGVTLRNPVNNLGFGIFGSYKGVEGLTVNVGFAYNDEFAEHKGNLITLGAVYEFSIFALALDHVTTLGKENSYMYSALCLETAVTENWIIETQLTTNLNLSDSKAAEFIPELGAAYVNGNHKIRAGVAVTIADETAAVSFPVYYKYSF